MNTHQIPILLYHSIAEPPTGSFRRWVVSPSLFEEHLRFLDSAGYTAMTVGDLIAARADGMLPTRPIVITFDDGFADFATTALPALQRYGLTATLYVTTGFLDGTARWLAPQGEGSRTMLAASALPAIAAAGIEVGAHSRHHQELDQLDAPAAHDEIAGSKRDLESILDVPVTTFAYPHGFHGPGVRHLVHEAGFESACAVKHAMSDPHNDQLALRRIIVDGEATTDDLAALLAGKGLRRARDGETLRTKGWRHARRLRSRVRPLVAAEAGS